jgi:hypothetical protein
MDRDGFMRFLAGTGNMGQMHRNIFTIGISWNQLVTERKTMKGTQKGKEKCQQKLYHQKDIVEQYGQVNMTSK